MGPWQWYYGDGEQSENYLGPCDTRDEAIEAGRSYFSGETFAIIEAVKGSTESLCPPSADDVISMIIDQNEDQWGDDGWDDFDNPAEAKIAEAELDTLLKTWWSKHHHVFPAPWLFADTRNHEVFPAPAGEDQ